MTTKTKRPPDANRLVAIAFLTLLSATIILFSALNFTGLRRNLNSEITFEMLFARHVAETGNPFSRTFAYGYDLFAGRPSVIAGLFDAVLHDMLLSYSLMLIVNMALLILAVIYLLRSMGIGVAGCAAALTAYMVIPSFVHSGYSIWLFNGYLGFYAVFSCVSLGFYIRIDEMERSTSLPIKIAALALAAFLLGATGSKGTQYISLPLLLLSLALRASEYFRGGALKLRRSDYFAASIFLASVCGLFVMHLVRHRFWLGGLPTEMNYAPAGKILGRMGENLVSLAQLANIDNGGRLLSLQGMAYLGSLTAFVIALYVAFRCLGVDRYRKGVGFLLMATGLTFALLVLVEWKLMPRYYISYPILFAVVIGIAVDHAAGRRLIVLSGALCAAISFMWAANVKGTYWQYTKGVASAHQDIADWALANGYSQGNTMQASGVAVAALTNGKVRVGNSSLSGRQFSTRVSGLPLSYFSSTTLDTPSFFFINTRELPAMAEVRETHPMFKIATRVREVGANTVFEFPVNPFIEMRWLSDDITRFYPICANILLRNVDGVGTSVVSDGSGGRNLEIRMIKGDGRDYDVTVQYEVISASARGKPGVMQFVENRQRSGWTQTDARDVVLAPGKRSATITNIACKEGYYYNLFLATSPGSRIRIESFTISRARQ